MNNLKMKTRSVIAFVFLVALAVSFAGCSGSKPKAQQRDFFTSGSKEADQRASAAGYRRARW